MRIIAIANQKGGCGKTTTAINLSACLAFLRKKTLLIDLDPQGHSTCGLGVKAEFLGRTAYHIFDPQGSSIDDLCMFLNDHLQIIPSDISLCEAEKNVETEVPHDCLVSALEKLTIPFDYIIIDCPPNLGFLTFNALRSSEEIIVPIEPSFFSLHGLAKIFETLDSMKAQHGKRMLIHALMTRFEKRSKLGREIREEVIKHFQNQVFVSTIDENIRLREAAAAGKSIVDFDREATGFRNYMNLAIELIERGLISSGGSSQEETYKQLFWEEQQGKTALPLLASNEAGSGLQVKENGHMGEETNPIPAAREPAINETVPPAYSIGAFERESAETGSHTAALLCEDHVPKEIQGKISIEVPSIAPKEVLGGVLFTYWNPDVRSVMIAGDFNRWIAEPLFLLDREKGIWQKIIPISKGVHRYKLLADDMWITDPGNDFKEANAYGGEDSILNVEGKKEIYEDRKEA